MEPTCFIFKSQEVLEGRSASDAAAQTQLHLRKLRGSLQSWVHCFYRSVAHRHSRTIISQQPDGTCPCLD